MEAASPAMRAAGPMARAEWALVAALFLAAFLGVLLTANHYGPTYDEQHYLSGQVQYAEWWLRLAGGDLGALRAASIRAAWSFNHEHPPLQKSAVGFSRRLFGGALSGLAAERLPSALWFGLLIAVLYLFTRGVWGRRGALFSALALATMPRVVAHAHLAALDMPITAWFFITAALTAEALRRNSWGWTVLAGIAFGLALLSKMNAFFLPVLLLPWGLIWHRQRWPKLLAVLLVMGPIVFWLGWPWLWIAPISHVREYLAFHLGHAAYNAWYLGRVHEYAPWHYPFVLTLVTTPVLLLALAIAGAARSWPRRGSDSRRALLLLGLAVAILPSALPTSPKYNGVRLFLPAFPFLAALAGGGFAWLQSGLTERMRLGARGGARLSALACVALAGIVLYPGAHGVFATHPYQLAYYNRLAGGSAGATSRGFETIYWGQVFASAPSFLNDVPEESPRVLVVPKGVISLLTYPQRVGIVRPDVHFTGDEAEAGAVDYVMFQAMQSDYTELCWTLAENEDPTWALRLGETPLLLIYDREAASRALSRLAK